MQCAMCQKLDKVFASQQMKPLPKEILKLSLACQYTSVVLFVQYKIKEEVKKSCRGKAYGLVFNCCVSRVVYVDIAADCSTEEF